MMRAWRQLISTWLSLDGRFRMIVVGVAAAVTLAWLSSPIYVLAVAVAIAAVALAHRLTARFRWRGLAAVGVLILVVVVLWRAFQGVANPAPNLPDQPAPIALDLPPGQDQVQALVAADPGSPDTWMAAGFALRRLQPTDPGVAAFERVLLMDPSQSRAALELAATFLRFGPTPLDEQLATYYTAVAGYPAPELPRQP
jgi:cytochrome c-type biogenesis protein CcmH/NrfG